jgi:hypothetical protein
MSSIVIKGDTSGQITLDAPAVAGTNVLSLPAVTATLATNINGTLYPIVAGTAVASTSGTSVDFTNLPSWVERITVQFSGVSTNGSSIIIVQLGTGATPTYTTSGYLGASVGGLTGVSPLVTNYSTGFMIGSDGAATYVRHGTLVLSNITGNTWVASSALGLSDSARFTTGGGTIALAAALTAVRITTVNGTDAFDAGTVNILYE